MISVLIVDSHSGPKKLGENFKIDFLGLGFLGLGLGLLQVVLDKGERDDWFGSPFIVWSTVVAVACLVALIVWEFFTDHPVVDLRLFKDRNFAISTFMMYILGFVLYSTTVLLPLLLQTLMGYTAMRSGMVLLPGGLVLLAILPSVGWMLGKFEPRWIVVTGLCIMALGLHLLSRFTLTAGESNAVNDWIFSRAGTAFLFVPINVMAFYFVPPGKMNNASGLINLARNIGASTGISFVTTMLDRRAQFHQDVLSSNLNGGSPFYQHAMSHITHEMMARGMDAMRAAEQAHAVIYLQLQRQSMMLSFVDNFWFMSMVCLCVIPLMFIMKKRKGPPTGRAPIH
jgi:MFS transporter, DHA2 family, multidrug resistance protein